MAGVASFGGRAAFIGRVRDDELGQVFAHDIRAVGVSFARLPAPGGCPTGRCLIVVTPDAERTLNTYLGAAAELGPDDVDPDLVAGAQVTYLEGYLWDQPPAKEAFRHAAQARARGRAAGRAHPLRRVLRRPPPRRLPRARRARRRHPVRQRGRDLLALRGRRLRRRAPAGPRPLRDRRADAQREGLGDRPRRRGPRDRRRTRSPAAWSTPPAPATSTRRASSTASPTATTSGPAGGSASLAAAEVISHLGARPETSPRASSHDP